MNTLTIDTSSNQAIIVGIKIDNKQYAEHKKIDANKSQVVLSMIEDVLKKHNLKLEDLNAIEVNAGPGSFTGVRIGISIANALSFALKIPANNKKVGEYVEALYNKV